MVRKLEGEHAAAFVEDGQGVVEAGRVVQQLQHSLPVDDVAAKARADAQAIAQQLQTKFPQTDYAARAALLVYKMQQSIPIYGSDRD